MGRGRRESKTEQKKRAWLRHGGSRLKGDIVEDPVKA
jgi:hypothetical protein